MIQHKQDSLRLLTYNIDGCIGRDRLEDPQRVLDVIQHIDADVVALQEVHDTDASDLRFLDGLNKLPYESVIYGQTMLKENIPYGNILMLRKQPAEIERLDLYHFS